MTPSREHRPLRCWTVVQLIPALGPGGAERSTMEVARALVAKGHRSVVISGGGRWVTRLKAEGSEHITLPIGSKSLGLLGTLFRLRACLKKLKPNIVHARSRLPAWLLRFALIGVHPRTALVTTVHGLNSVSGYSRIMTRGDRVIVVSNMARDHVLKHYSSLDPERVRVIPRGADPGEFPPGYKVSDEWRTQFLSDYPMLKGGPLLTLPGRGTRLKGHAEAIELLARLHADGIKARLLLLGVDEQRRDRYGAEMRQLAREYGVHRFVAMSPSRGDVRDIYAISHLILQMSVRPESFGRVVAEALCQGRPVLGYDHGGVGELLRALYPAGCVPPRDLDAACERAKALLKNPPPVNSALVPKIADLQRLTLAVYAELCNAGPVDAAFQGGAGAKPSP